LRLSARTQAQLEDNLKALDVRLTPEQVAKLDALDAPTLNFPAVAELRLQHPGRRNHDQR
jgi:diketogulonate reductase-like aldo/keto reductase